ncbi:MAG TPA: DUF1127 domain-containing protein [Xanthobacteraceae bacterium]|nr:DUF1127 domain-containing protein [Xanthobacteraceae bacterium]
MTIFPLDIVTRVPVIFVGYLLHWRRKSIRAELDDLSDKNLEDIGFKRSRQDFDAVKPFWMP